MKKGLTKATIKGRAVKIIYSDGTEDVSVTIYVGNAKLNEKDVASINHVLEFVKEHPSRTIDFRKPVDDYEAEEAIEESEAKLERALNNMDDY